jgi:two-component SAPR family response regulator
MEYGLATETDSADVELILGMGRAYLLAHRPADAAVQFQRAVQLEPLYAEPYLRLASALEVKGDKPAAAKAYVQFLQRLSQDDYRRVDIQHKLQLLAGSP